MYKKFLITVVCVLLAFPLLTACSVQTMPINHGKLAYFEYYLYGHYGFEGERPTVYKAIRADDHVLVEYSNPSDKIVMVYSCELDFLDELELLISETNLDAWDGFDQADYNVMDGSRWTLKIDYSDGQVSAAGDNAYPKDYYEKIDQIHELFFKNTAGAKPYTGFTVDSLARISGDQFTPIDFSEGSIETQKGYKQFFNEIDPDVPDSYLADVKDSVHELYQDYFRSNTGEFDIDWEMSWLTMDYSYNDELFTFVIAEYDLDSLAEDIEEKLVVLYDAYQMSYLSIHL